LYWADRITALKKFGFILFSRAKYQSCLNIKLFQSLKLLDQGGRSALHYAATLPDSGQMFKYLVNLGADPNVKDADNNTPGIYLRNRELLTHQHLLDEKPLLVEAATPAVERWERPRTPPGEV